MKGGEGGRELLCVWEREREEWGIGVQMQLAFYIKLQSLTPPLLLWLPRSPSGLHTFSLLSLNLLWHPTCSSTTSYFVSQKFLVILGLILYLLSFFFYYYYVFLIPTTILVFEFLISFILRLNLHLILFSFLFFKFTSI